MPRLKASFATHVELAAGPEADRSERKVEPFWIDRPVLPLILNLDVVVIRLL